MPIRQPPVWVRRVGATAGRFNMTAPVVIKLGGSLLSDPRDGRLMRWCERLTGAWAGRAIVVPGGGPFADAVRAAQADWRFSDDVAHRMALRAMDQCGLMLSDLCPDLPAVQDIDALVAVCESGRTPVWLPALHLDRNADMPRDWNVTSDSIAVWLGSHLGSTRVVLVKSCALPEGDLTVLATRGIVDDHLPVIAAKCRLRIEIVTADSTAALR